MPSKSVVSLDQTTTSPPLPLAPLADILAPAVTVVCSAFATGLGDRSREALDPPARSPPINTVPPRVPPFAEISAPDSTLTLEPVTMIWPPAALASASTVPLTSTVPSAVSRIRPPAFCTPVARTTPVLLIARAYRFPPSAFNST